jgi:isopentenyl diphosphate isomerase/L-lactate dehydrogenase-like FMN-dependent dehydrogenase
MAGATRPVWFRLYVFKDRAISASLVKRAEAAGCKAIVFTVDVPLLGRGGISQGRPGPCAVSKSN